MESGKRKATSAPCIVSAAYKRCMFAEGDLVLAAVSGGPDSVAMLHALHTCADDLGISLHIAHLNHQLRGDESNLDEEFVRELGHGFRLEVSVGRVDVSSLARERRLGLEEAAREVRYKFMHETATKVGADKIAVGHTADDRAESVLMAILRGTGTDGLAAMRPVRGNVVRPLIETWRAEIETYIEKNAMPYRVDETNLDVTYTRNRVRHELIPLLERDYNPQVKAALVRLAEIAAAEADLMADETRPAVDRTTLGGAIDAGLLVDLPLALQRRVLRSEIEREKGDLVDVEFEQIERVLDAVHAGEDFTIALPSGRIYAVRAGDRLSIGQRRPPVVVEPFERELNVPGTTAVPEAGLTVEAVILESADAGRLPPAEAHIDADSISGELGIRSVRPGDRIVPFGMRGAKKLQDILVDGKIPRDQRARTAVVADDEKILWVVGIVASEVGRVTAKTRRVIHLVAAPDR